MPTFPRVPHCILFENVIVKLKSKIGKEGGGMVGVREGRKGKVGSIVFLKPCV